LERSGEDHLRKTPEKPYTKRYILLERKVEGKNEWNMISAIKHLVCGVIQTREGKETISIY